MNLLELERPSWLKKRLCFSEDLLKTKDFLKVSSIGTVCESSLCPNLNECFSKRRATFLILGDICTRSCAFCAVNKGIPKKVVASEIFELVEAIKYLGLKHVIITSVTRDDLEDGGAGQFIKAIQVIRDFSKDLTVEVLVPDFSGNAFLVKEVALANPDIFSHNIETTRARYGAVRAGADYDRSLGVLAAAKEYDAGIVTKSGLMVGLGEKAGDVTDVMKDLRAAGCDMLTIGQYLKAGPSNIPVKRFVTPEEFEEYRRIGEGLGFKHVASGPFVRSSYLAEEAYKMITQITK